MHIQNIDIKIVSVQLHVLKHHLEGDGLSIFDVHHLIRLRPQGFLDEAEEMLLVHARRRVDVGVDFSGGYREVIIIIMPSVL